MNNLKISIVTVSYNAAQTIEQTIQSVINQTCDNIEYIIIDGGSTDGTVDIIRKYADEIAYWVSEPDNGIYDAMNKGIDVATGEIIGIINSDDWYGNLDVLNEVGNTFDNTNCDMVCGDVIYYNENGIKLEVNKCISKPMLSEMKKRMNIAHPTVFVKKNIYDKYGNFDTNYKVAADYDLMLRLFNNKINAVYNSKIIVNFRLGGASSFNSFHTLKEVYFIRKNNNVEIFDQYRYLFEDVILFLINLIINLVRK